MKTKTITLYTYDELSEKAKEKALNDYRANNDYYFLNDFITEYVKELLEENEILDTRSLEIFYSLGYCQGDGACFIGSFKWNGYDIKITKTSHHYQHMHTTQIELFKDGEEIEEDDKNGSIFQELYFSICKKIEKFGYGLIDDENSEEGIKAYFEGNDITFRENGEIENE